MGNIRLASGRRANLLARARLLTFSSQNATYPAANAVDGVVGKPWISAGGTLESIEADLSANLTGDFETWAGAVPVGTTANHTGTGVGAEDAVTFFNGTKSAKLTPGAAGVSEYYWDDTVASGEETRFIAQLRITAGAGTARIRLQCRETLRYLAPTGLWQDAAIDAFTSTTSGAWDSKALTATMEGLEATGLDELTLRTYIRTTDAGVTANFDAIHHFPTWDVASVHGHNTNPSQSVAVYGGDTSPAGTLLATLVRPASLPAFYVRSPARQTYRYFKITWPSPNTSPLFAGDVALWQSRVPTLGWQTLSRTINPFQVRGETQSGHSTGGVRLALPRRRLEMKFQGISQTTQSELAGEIWSRTREGIDPVIIIPDDDLPEVIYGRVPNEPHTQAPMVQSAVVDFSLAIVEDGLPTVGL